MADNKNDNGFILQAALIAGIAYFALKPLLNIFDSADKDYVQSVEALPASQNAFSYMFQPYLDVYTTKNGRNRFGSTGEKQYWVEMREMLLRMPGVYSVFDEVLGLDNYVFQNGDPDIAYLAESLIKAVSAPFIGDSDEALRIFGLVESQVTVAAMAAYIYYNYGWQLLPFMSDGNTGFMPFDGLRSSVIADIVKRVYSLPVTVLTD